MIVVDSREKFIQRIKEIIALGDSVDFPMFRFECLDFGDYHIESGGHELRIERKSISDFVANYRVLKARLHQMRMRYEHTALLLEGVYSLNNGMVCVLEGGQLVPRMEYRTFSNFLTHQAALGTWIFHTMTFDETVYRLVYIHNYLPKLDAPTPAMKCGSVAEWLVQLPGIGAKTVEKLQAQYGSPLAAINSGLPKKAYEVLQKWG